MQTTEQHSAGHPYIVSTVRMPVARDCAGLSHALLSPPLRGHLASKPSVILPLLDYSLVAR